jgi:hypothetical protein
MAVYAKNGSGTVIRIMNNPAGLKYPTVDGTSGQVLVTNGAGVLSWSSAPASGLITGSSTSNYVTKFTNTSSTTPTIGSSSIFDDGTNVCIGTASALNGAKFTVNGFAAFGNSTQAINVAISSLRGTIATSGTNLVPIVFTIGSSEYLYLDTSGNLGVGVTPSGTYKLQVSGSATFTSISNTRLNPRVTSTASSSSVTPDVSSVDIYAFTALATSLAIDAPVGTPVDGNKLLFRIKDDGTSRTLTWNATYTALGVVLPTATPTGKTIYVGAIYNANLTRWDVIAVTTD